MDIYIYIQVYAVTLRSIRLASLGDEGSVFVYRKIVIPLCHCRFYFGGLRSPWKYIIHFFSPCGKRQYTETFYVAFSLQLFNHLLSHRGFFARRVITVYRPDRTASRQAVFTASGDNWFPRFARDRYKVEQNYHCSEVRSCVKVEVVVLGSLSLIVLMVCLDEKQHLKKKKKLLRIRAQELCENRGGRPGVPVRNST